MISPLQISTVMNGVSQAMLLFLIASGLSLIFGLMGVVNFAHGAFYALGGYLAVAVFGFTNSFWIALLVAPFIVAGVGVLIEYTTIRPLYKREAIYQVLLTFGMAIVIQEAIILVAGTDTYNLQSPDVLTGIVEMFGTFYPLYRLSLIAAGIIVGVLLWLMLDRTRIGIIVRAGTFDSEMVEALGINIRRVFTAMFGLGVLLAAVGGIMAAPLLSVTPDMGIAIIIDAFIVVVVGGLGSIRGSFIGALIIGLAEAFGSFYISKFVGFVIFTLMIIVLLVRPYGLLGQPGIFEE